MIDPFSHPTSGRRPRVWMTGWLALPIVVALAMIAAAPKPTFAQTPGGDTPVDVERAATETSTDTVPLDSATVASAYLDAGARDLVRLARERLRVVDRSIVSYQAEAAEKFSVRVRALRRERLLWGREVVTRIDWERDGPVRIEIIGAREVIPALIGSPQVPDGLDRYVPGLAFDPSEPYLVEEWFAEGEEVFGPLAAGSEADYRFRSGGSRTIRLQDGREIRLVELQLIPRRNVPSLVEGSLWLDDATYSIVQATFRPAAPNRILDAGPLGSVEVSIEYVTVEFGLWDLQWWLPRVASLRGVARVSGVGSGSIQYERVYSDYIVDGVPQSVLLPVPADTADSMPRCRREIAISIGGEPDADEETGSAVTDTVSEVAEERDNALEPNGSPASAGSATAAANAEEEPDPCGRYEVVLPPDSIDLMASEHLTAQPFDLNQSLLTDTDLAAIQQRLDEFAAFVRPRPELSLEGPLGEPGLIRYNRVEGLSLGLRGRAEMGPLDAAATVRLGVADLEPNARLELGVDWEPMRISAAGYRDLVAMDPVQRPFSLGASVSSLFLGNDDGDYFRVLGAELTGEPSPRHSPWYDWRLYAQRERGATKKTDFSLPHLFDSTDRFPANELADDATQFGAALRLRGEIGDDPVGFRASTELGFDAATGTFRYARPSLTVRTHFPLPGSIVGLLEGAAGTSYGDLGTQHLWRLGGPGTLRGYDSGSLTGESFWRGRAEIGTELPAIRLILFSDAAWAGEMDALELSPQLVSAGVGVSLLDGLLRLDLSRALEAPTGWRLTTYFDGWL